jgi:hypothetical protein
VRETLAVTVLVAGVFAFIALKVRAELDKLRRDSIIPPKKAGAFPDGLPCPQRPGLPPSR